MSYQYQGSCSNIYYSRYIRVKEGVEKRDDREEEGSKRRGREGLEKREAREGEPAVRPPVKIAV
jgi:hypothetical protein